MSGQTALENAWTFWYHRKSKGGAESYEDSIKSIATFDTVEEFWQIYNHLRRPDEVTVGTDYHLFRAGVKPTWEDEHNRAGGKWIVRLKKGLVSRYWEELLIAMIGEQLSDSASDICGAVVSVRYSEDSISIWNRSSRSDAVNARIKQMARKFLRLPSFVKLEYKPHEDSIIDNQREEWRRSHDDGHGGDNKATPTGDGGDGTGWMKSSTSRRSVDRSNSGSINFRRDRRESGDGDSRSGTRPSYGSSTGSSRAGVEGGRPRGVGSWGNARDGERGGDRGDGGDRAWTRRGDNRKGDEVKDWRRRA
eukprot:CAMPEP_0118850670 /NCGR_PEP_ID=MMETSP1163-20130328/418_1 /TAXON_ID=124430 /ORGANISM="Phaeomonas parva, Strain CCMP2877" /LENGTH=305 /DNA_ID=CAMNT_0006782899 /DNA_START=332 /DNA_END=1249 /DNA_ORIENTATION=-